MRRVAGLRPSARGRSCGAFGREKGKKKPCRRNAFGEQLRSLRGRVLCCCGRGRGYHSGGETKKKELFGEKKIQKTPPEELRRARARLYTIGRAFFACHVRARGYGCGLNGKIRKKDRPENRRNICDGGGACAGCQARAEIAQMRRGDGSFWQPQRGGARRTARQPQRGGAQERAR